MRNGQLKPVYNVQIGTAWKMKYTTYFEYQRYISSTKGISAR